MVDDPERERTLKQQSCRNPKRENISQSSRDSETCAETYVTREALEMERVLKRSYELSR